MASFGSWGLASQHSLAVIVEVMWATDDFVEGALMLSRSSGMPLYTGKESWTAFKSNMEKEFAARDWENFVTTVPTKADASHAEHKRALQTLFKHIHSVKQTVEVGTLLAPTSGRESLHPEHQYAQ
ncbi:hypothetical protein HDU67_001385 [Dinochytrium kinnereticum]|nr:hypothetical protein HDU67_001385 [Dinochytrium kinnereticum]